MSTKNSQIINVEGLNFAYQKDKWVLRDVNFTIAAGEIVGLVGLSGSGKTTLAHILKGLIPQSIKGYISGRVFVDGKETIKSTINAMAKTTGMVFQDLNAQLFCNTVREEIEFGLHNLKMDLNEATNAMKILDILDIAQEIPMNLSAGQKQRVILASVLAMKPKILILDEPSAHLDQKGKERLKEWLKQVNNEMNTTIIIIDQNPWLIGELCSELYLLEEKSLKKVFREELLEKSPTWVWKTG